MLIRNMISKAMAPITSGNNKHEDKVKENEKTGTTVSSPAQQSSPAFTANGLSLVGLFNSMQVSKSSGSGPLKFFDNIVSTAKTLVSSSSLVNKLSNAAMDVVLSVLGFDVKNLDTKAVSQVDFLGYFATIMKKSTPELMESIVKTILQNFLAGNTKSLADDVKNTLISSLLGVDASELNMTDGEYSSEEEALNAWSLSTVISTISSKSTEEQQAILDSIVELAPYLLNEEYRNDAESPESIPDDFMQTAKNCIAASIYDNLGAKSFMNEEPWEIIETTKNPETGYFGRVYINKETKEIIIANLATSSAEDVVTDDLDMMTGKIPDQYEDAVKHALSVLTNPEYSGYNITITGHSLGGSLTELVAVTQEVQDAASANNITLNAVSLNGFGITNIIKNNSDGYKSADGNTRYHFVTEENNKANIYSFITEDDLVCCSTKHVGKTILFNNENKIVPHMLNSMEEILNEMTATAEPSGDNRYRSSIASVLNTIKNSGQESDIRLLGYKFRNGIGLF